MNRTLLPVAGKLQQSKLLRAISGGFSALLPVIMVGAIASLLAGFNVEAYQTFIEGAGLKRIFSYVSSYTTNMTSLFAVFAIAHAYANQVECREQATLVGLSALMTFLMLIPLGMTQDEVTIEGALDVTYLGSAGLFAAMIIGLSVAMIYNLTIKNKLEIRMPDGVPPMIAQGFSAIIPCLIIAVVACVVRELCALTEFGSFAGLIYGVLRAPLASLSQSPLTFALLVFICNLCWFFGIHGGMVTMPFISMLYMQPALDNLAAYAAGEALPNLLTNTWWFTFVQLGGSGGIIGLAVCMFLFAKSERYRTLGKLAILPALCGISEPIVFGLPLMLNVLFFLPMLLTPLLSFALSYAATVLGVLPYLNGVQLSVGTPVLLSGFLTGGVPALVWQLVLVALQFGIYYPFFTMADRQALDEEAAAAAEA